MRSRAAVCVAAMLTGGLLAGAPAYSEGPHKLPEPWAGYWWPFYEHHEDSLHLWQGGGGIYGDTPGPIYDHDTRYFWLPESIRDSAQYWEIAAHRDTLPSTNGHCYGVTCASIMEPDTLPQDCGALSQDDLEGLLTEINEDRWLDVQTTTGHPAKPGDVWLCLREWLKVQPNHAPKVLAANLDTAFVWYFAVYGYRIDGDVIDDTLFDGVMTLYYEDHKYGVLHAPESAWYRFQCNVTGPDTHPVPDKEPGTWVECHGPFGINSPPNYFCTAESLCHVVNARNPYVCGEDMAEYDTLKRVIDHKLIILDDAYRDSTEPVDPPSGFWVRRPGFADSCWAVQEPPMNPEYHMHWYPRLCSAGQWSVYAYKTPPVEGDTLNDNANVWLMPLGYWSLDQSQSPFDTWQLLGTCYVDPDSLWYVCADNKWWSPWNCYTYYDAVRLEYVGEGEDGGTGSPMVRLGDLAQRMRVWPSPARGEAQISYALPASGHVDIVVYDVSGRAVLRAARGIQRAGPQTAAISVARLPSGTYIARVTAKGVSATCRFVVCR